jgi:hypothetical protein
LHITITGALALINNGISFATGTTYLLPSGGTITFDDAQKLVVSGGLKLPPGTPIATAGQDLSAAVASKFIDAGATFPDHPVVTVTANDLAGNSTTVLNKLLNFGSYGLKFVFDPTGQAAASGVQFKSGTLTLSGVNLTETQAESLVDAAVAGGLKFSNVNVTIDAAQLANASAWASKLAAVGITNYTLSRHDARHSCSGKRPAQLDSSFNLKCKLRWKCEPDYCYPSSVFCWARIDPAEQCQL